MAAGRREAEAEAEAEAGRAPGSSGVWLWSVGVVVEGRVSVEFPKERRRRSDRCGGK